MKKIYEAVKTALEKMSALRWIDLEAGQLELDQPPVAFPCALIDLQMPRAENLATKVQDCDLVVKVTLALLALGDANAAAPEPVRASALEFFNISNDVYKSLQGLEGEDFSPLERSAQINKTYRGLKKVEFSFKTNFADYSADPAQIVGW